MSNLRVYRLRQLASKKGHPGLLPVSPATIWRWVRQGNFVAPFSLGPSTTVWDAAQVDEWLAARAAGGAK
jgi:prophage regulatory protein